VKKVWRMETVNFGTFLREARERRQMSLADLSHSTKLSVSALKVMETGNLDDLPPEIFVRGFIRSYAKSIGISSHEPLGLLDQTLSDRHCAPAPVVALVNQQLRRKAAPVEQPLPLDPQGEEEGQTPRRGIGLAVFVIIMLLIATITLSLFVRQQPPSGEGLSFGEPAADVAVRAAGRWG
jgi:cytoskeletal protein RodZ